MSSSVTPTRRFIYALFMSMVMISWLGYHFSYNKIAGRPFASSSLTSQPFPSKIWQSWKDDSENPTDRTAGFSHQWQLINSNWRYERITDSNNDAYVQKNFDPIIGNIFTEISDPILKADLLRYLILLHEGGVWADIDVYPIRPISKWIPKEYSSRVNLVVGVENDHHKQPIWPGSPYSVQLCQYVVLSKPGHPAVKALVSTVIDDLTRLMETKPAGSTITFEDVMSTTGPFAFTKAMMEYFKECTGLEHTGDELDSLDAPRLIGDVLVLPRDSFGWLSFDNTHMEGDPMILVKHIFMASWRGTHPG